MQNIDNNYEEIYNNQEKENYNDFIKTFAQIVEKYGNKLLDKLNDVA